jgi:hypothetical protein
MKGMHVHRLQRSRLAAIFAVIFVSFGFETGVAASAEITIECPRVNDSGTRLATYELQREGGGLLVAKRVEITYSGTIRDSVQLFRQHGDRDPIEDATFVCRYRDRSMLQIPIAGALLRCRTLSVHLRKVEYPRSWCISEIDDKQRAPP